MAASPPIIATVSRSPTIIASGTAVEAIETAEDCVMRSPIEYLSCHVVRNRIIRSQTAPLVSAVPRTRIRSSATLRTYCQEILTSKRMNRVSKAMSTERMSVFVAAPATLPRMNGVKKASAARPAVRIAISESSRPERLKPSRASELKPSEVGDRTGTNSHAFPVSRSCHS